MSIFSDLTDITIHFSNSLGIPIIDAFGKKRGKVTDFFVDFDELYPQVFALQLKKKNKFFYIYWNEIKRFS
jgi:sporulation protein YlmC with PRC-barrel domain